MPDAELKQLADNLRDTVKRDLAFFAKRNIDLTSLQKLDALTTAFDETSTDEEMAGLLKVATAEKDSVAGELKKAIRSLRNMAAVAYKGAGKYAVFSFEDMASMSDADLCRLGKRVVRVARKLKADLEPEGLTDEQLTELSNLCIQLDAAIDNTAAQVENRDLETQDRIIKGNALYKEVTRLASIGKTLFEDTDEARFNDYLVIESKGKKSNTDEKPGDNKNDNPEDNGPDEGPANQPPQPGQ